MLSAISRKDLFAQTQDNKAYVTGELNDLIENDAWQVYNPNKIAVLSDSAGFRDLMAFTFLDLSSQTFP
jgi:hypothetical protein